MTFTSDTEIERIGRGLLDRSLPKPEWTHAAHFAAAVWLLSDDQIDALDVMPGAIRAYNESTGVANTDTSGYHETITRASLHAARYVIQRSPPHAAMHTLANAILAGEFGRSDWLLAYWSRPLLFSPEARRRWIDPDIKALPF
jgi:hypothetical protein